MHTYITIFSSFHFGNLFWQFLSVYSQLQSMMIMRNRDITVTIRLNKEEKRILEELSKESGYSQSGYLISLFHNQRPRPIPPLEYNVFINQLRSIGNNLNQIATKANELNFIDTKSYYEEVNKLHDVIKEIEKQIQLPEEINSNGNNEDMGR